MDLPNFANICIRIIEAFFHIKQNSCAILEIKQLPYKPKSKNSEEIGYFEVYLPKQRQKHASSFVMNF